ncbi:MAG: phosphodiester glycosidase family protein [Desulfovibrio sp.]|nr:phosphodiester glycosidase family protein [Desulfovibrio sp.]
MKILIILIFFVIVSSATHSVESFAKSVAAPPLPSVDLTAPQEGRPDRLGLDAAGRPAWIGLEPGLDFGEFRLNGDESKITALRVDPAKFDFFLGASSQDGGDPRSLDKWAKEYDLLAAINASMYLPDNRTSTGFMRSGDHVNQGRVMERFGAFFVAGPKKDDIPRATIIDKDLPDWRERLDDYNIVVQNYRMTSADRRILWSPGGPASSISAIAQDGDGNILFLHSRAPVEVYNFAHHLLHLPLDIRTVMYVEGGAQAGLLINTGAIKRELGAPHAPSFLAAGVLKAILPNIIGVKQNSKN